MSKIGKTILCPGADYKLSEGETFIVIAEDETALTPSIDDTPVPEVAGYPRELALDVVRYKTLLQPDNILIVGWNRELLPSVMYELENCMLAGSEVTILATKSIEDREKYIEMLQRRKGGHYFKNIGTIKQVQGSLEAGQRSTETIQLITNATRAFILGDENTPPCMSDASALAAILLIREILASAGKLRMIPAVPEIRDVSSARLCRHIHVYDFLETSVIPAQIISSLAVQPKIAPVLLDLLSSRSGAIIATHPISHYSSQAPDWNISFLEAMKLVTQSGDVLIGWTKEKTDEADPYSFSKRISSSAFELLSDTDWEINPPDKTTKRSWSDEADLLCVISWKDHSEADRWQEEY
jgi:hypothetical protein